MRVPHQLVGGGWVYLGTYYFNAGSNPASGSVIISNQGERRHRRWGDIADAIRFGNGMGDVNNGGGSLDLSAGRRRRTRYWIQRSLGQGQPTSLYTAAT